tara:strand:- start:4365 stop:6092 length:1728 start_codon:yes stop_codon:yes gene_type:complete
MDNSNKYMSHNNLYLESEQKFNHYKKQICNIDPNSVNFVKKFSNQGKQGVTGIADVSGCQCVYKLSQNLNFIARHEYEVMRSLNKMSEYCPHFCKVYDIIQKKVNGNYKKQKNPFEISSKHPINIDVILMEHINSPQFYSLIKNKEISNDIIFSTIKQLLLAVNIAQNKKRFSHYDLHSCNVMINKCDKDDVFLYSVDDDNHYCVPTNGMYPVIIDFGFSYLEELDNKPIWASLAHTDVGFMTNQYDHIADPKLLLVTMSDELKRYRNSMEINKFRNIVRNIFDPLNIDWESGWDIYGSELGAANYISEHLENTKIESKIFTKYNHICIDIIQSLIKLPLSPQNTDNLDVTYKLFVNEFAKIEKEISNSFYNIYIFKYIVDIARQIKHDYSKDDKREYTIKYFKRCILDAISKVASYCTPKDVDYEKLLCGIYVFSQNCEGILYKIIEYKSSKKKYLYNKLPLQNVEQMFASIEINLPHNYTFNKNTKIHIFDADNEKRDVVKNLPPYIIDLINDIHPFMRGCFINDYYKGEFEYLKEYFPQYHPKSRSRRSSKRQSRSRSRHHSVSTDGYGCGE